MIMEEIWPPYAVTITSGELSMRVVRDDDLPELVDLVLSGIHDPDRMPFSFPWTDVDPAELPANFVRYHWQVRSQLSPARFSLEFAVRQAGEMVGIQGFSAQDFAVTRTGETGSWLARRFHGRGIGTRMRRAICAFLFDELGATEITSGAFTDNPASKAVSRKVGYRPNGTQRLARRGTVGVIERLVLAPEDFVRGDEPVQVTGARPLRSFLKVDR
ncbi:GNAT family N-acetyltransferase [Microlunatus sp. Gsoil 973]|uniref:GNAT family N-acetyltransferase n=1 Tax=Microlunatus sp. Gsoil 973 TaxID=2672569 RepID=UPI0012B4D89D|nr:GNAT family protein [Microlunatus sp. Gsoil 973]QGN33101.1 GNAT family N-acetyltransferase [Microlunatus sp. Gsoil 973]